MAKIILDANVFVYSILDEHPAALECERFIIKNSQLYQISITPLTPFEIYFILWKTYGLLPEDAYRKVNSLLQSPIDMLSLYPDLIQETLVLVKEEKLDINDALMVNLCLFEEIQIIGTDDGRLMRVAEKSGIITQSPITEETRNRMRLWEEEKLAKKGLERILHRIFLWLEKDNPNLANKLKEETSGFRYLP